MTTYLYTIDCISNMHVGSGKDNFGVIDRLIQRDPVTNYPYISASGLKGALLEHCRLAGMKSEYIDLIFGKEGKGNSTPSRQGHYRFLDAHLLLIPVAASDAPFRTVTSKGIVAELKSTASLLGITLDEQALQSLLSASKRLSNEEFGCCVGDDSLPVIARNNIRDGKSANLWYEQVLPRKSRLAFFIIHDDTTLGKDNDMLREAFDKAVNGQVVQIGANASIGYGLSEIKRFNP